MQCNGWSSARSKVRTWLNAPRLVPKRHTLSSEYGSNLRDRIPSKIYTAHLEPGQSEALAELHRTHVKTITPSGGIYPSCQHLSKDRPKSGETIGCIDPALCLRDQLEVTASISPHRWISWPNTSYTRLIIQHSWRFGSAFISPGRGAFPERGYSQACAERPKVLPFL